MSTNVASQFKPEGEGNRVSPPRCKKPAGPLTRRQRSESHRIEMQTRRAMQLQRQPGFTSVINKRVSANVQGTFAELMVLNAEMVANGTVTVQGLQEQAVRRVAAKLPPERMVFDWRNQGRTKNDDASYRKPFVRQF